MVDEKVLFDRFESKQELPVFEQQTQERSVGVGICGFDAIVEPIWSSVSQE